MNWLGSYDDADGLVKPSVPDALLMPLSFDKALSTDPVSATLPLDYGWARLIYIATDGTSAPLTVSSRYGAGSFVLDTAKTALGAYAGTAVDFQAAVVGGGKADFMVEFTRE